MMRLIFMAAVILSGGVSLAQNKYQSTPQVANCGEIAVKALAAKLKISEAAISYLGGAMVGDGGYAVEVHILSAEVAKNKFQGYQVEFETDSADMCDSKVQNAIITRLMGQ